MNFLQRILGRSGSTKNASKRPTKDEAADFKVFRFTDDEKGRDALFRLQCKYGDIKIEKGKGTLAIVLDPRDEVPELSHPVKILADGRQMALLKVISEDGGFRVMATTPSDKGDRLVPGDFVAWVPFAYQDMEQLSEGDDKRIGWVGLIRGKVKWMEMGASDRLLRCPRFA
jgi:hypothetical protein